ncbi:MAG: universal stress protein [Desulfomonile tiedjei]|uniref:Universal stress protein n=1 Tax=Desulfomonile tiedjei TaxID=2358 RepID=A0A9D6Z2H7_9BACT|nr:universal stress protein [Desulfomonile tiedjei]
MKVLVAVDRNAETFVGLRYACHLLESCYAKVDALHVTPDLKDIAAESYAPFLSKDGLENAIKTEIQQVEEMFREAFQPCLPTNLPCALQITAGDPADEILNVAHSDGYDMIVLGSHQKSYLRGLLLGAVHAKILHYAEQPVLIVRQFREIHRVLVAYRGSHNDDASLRFLGPLLANKNAEITLLHVQETGQGESDEFARASLQKGAQILRDFDFDPLARMAKGDFVEEILKDVAVNRHDLIVMGAYGHKRPKYLQLISDEAHNLARLTTRPILVFRETIEVRTA